VQPPFVAPPTDGARRRRGWSISLTISALVLLCLGGIGGGVGVVVLANRAVHDEAVAAVDRYLSALRDQDYNKAYGLLCEPLQASITRERFAAIQQAQPRVTDFQVGEPEVAGQDLTVPATVQFSDGTQRSVRFAIFQDKNTGELQACGEVQ
jgi:hypothetical protein